MTITKGQWRNDQRVEHTFDRRREQLFNPERAARIMRERGIDALVVSMIPHVYYFSNHLAKSSTGLHDNDAFGVVIIPREDPSSAALIIPDIDATALAQRGTWISDVRVFGGSIPPLGTPIDEAAYDRVVPQFVTNGAPWGAAARAGYIGDRDALVLQAIDDLGLSTGTLAYDNLRTAVARRGAEIIDGFGTVRKIRETKTPTEVDLMQASATINVRSIQATIDAWAPGMTWHDLCAQYNQHAVAFGGFPHDPGGVAVANPPGDDPAGYIDPLAEGFVLEQGTNIMFDCHGTHLRYAWDGGKTWFVGDEPTTPDVWTTANVAEEALLTIYEQLQPGIPVSRLQQAGLDVFRRRKLPHAENVNIFFHNLGLDHIDREGATRFNADQAVLPGGPADYAFEPETVATIHIIYPGSDRDRYYLEDCFLVQEERLTRMFSWDTKPHRRHV